jgi:hypothetical protein
MQPTARVIAITLRLMPDVMAGVGEVVAGGRSTSRAPSQPVNASASG